MTPDERAHIKAREAAATPGPWTWQSQTIGEHPRTLDDGERDLCSPGGPVVYYSQSTIWCSDADAAFIAAARTDVPALLAEVDRLTAELANAHDVIESLHRNLNAAGDALGALQSAPSGPHPHFTWWHLDGTECVAGWNSLTGECANGGGPVTPRERTAE